MRLFILLLIIVAGALFFTNPTEADFREHVREQTGIAGTVGMAVADLLSGGKQGAIKRENFFVCSRFYVGGEGIIPRQDLAWGVARQFIEIKGDQPAVLPRQ